MPAKGKFTPANPGKTYQVTAEAQQVGPFVHPAGFTELMWEKLHPIPDTEHARSENDHDTYHGDLLSRLVAMGKITENANAPVSHLEAGPYAGVQAANKAIRDSVAEHLQTESSRQSAAAVDAKALRTDNAQPASQPVVQPVTNVPAKPAVQTVK